MLIPKIHPAAIEPTLALAAIDYVAEQLPDVPASTTLLLNAIWSYGRRPPLVADVAYSWEEALQLSWQDALYEPGMAYLLGWMRTKGQTDTPERWFHDAVYIAATQVFQLFEACEFEHLPESLRSDIPSSVTEADGSDGLIDACGHALGNTTEFRDHFLKAQSRFEERLRDVEASRWPPLNGTTRAQAAEWFE